VVFSYRIQRWKADCRAWQLIFWRNPQLRKLGTNHPDIMLSLLLLCLSYRKGFLERIELLS
jgi:hypothetical protein